jgi:ligand-binding sensor domain-containing protein
MRLSRRTWWIAIFLFLTLGALLSVGAAFWNARTAWRHSTEQVRREGTIPYRLVRLDAAVPTGVEWISAPSLFRDAALYRDHFFLASPVGLSQYDSNGQLLSSYRVGLELPPAPLVAVATGVSPDSGTPELLVATSGEGLLLFDGSGFRQVRTEQPAYRKLTALLPLSTGRILLGTEQRGVLAYDGRRIAPFHPSLSGVKVTALAGEESSMWVGTLDQGVLHWQAGRAKAFSEGEGLPDPRVLSLAVAGERAYVGTAMGVAEFIGGEFTRVLAEGFLARTLLVRGDRLIVGTLTEGTLEIPLQSRPARRPAPSSPPFLGNTVSLRTLGGQAYAVAANGLYSIEASNWRPVVERERAVLADSNISALSFDPAGRLWVGYFDRGLDIVSAAGERTTHIENGYVFCVNRILPDPRRGLVAVATANGLVLFDSAGEQQQVLGRDQGLIANHVTDVVLRPEGMAVATPAGVTFMDSAGPRSLYAFHGLVNNHAYALGASGQHLLVGTLGGLSVLEGEFIQANYTTANSELRHNWITAVVPVGDDWLVGTYGAGILRLEADGHWESFPEATGAFEVNPNAMLATGERVYAGTLGLGLYVYNRAFDRWTQWTAGLPSSNVTALAARDGYLYVGTDNGLVRIQERAITAP